VRADVDPGSMPLLVGPDGRWPCFGWVDRFQHDPNWKDNLVFSEYFHGDNAAGLGAAHQTGWTGIVADVIRRRHGAVPSIGDVIRTLGEPPQRACRPVERHRCERGGSRSTIVPPR
jgi:hypothetical protein